MAASSFTASGLAVAIARRRGARDRLALSPREIEVLRLLRDGLSVPSIALAMFISQSTAKTYIARLYEKLGAANRTQALMTAMQRGLIHYGESKRGDAASSHGQPTRSRLAETERRDASLTPAGRPAAISRWRTA